jgi:hypothetical protein
MPGQVDSNSPAFWLDGQLHLLNSTGGDPVLSRGADQFQFASGRPVALRLREDHPTWFESVWVDPSGPVFAFYHQEDFSVCPAGLSQPRIGMAISTDHGESFTDLGLVLTSGDAPNCASQNGYFAGGHGDLSVVPDQAGQFFYFFFGNYSGPLETQGVVVARLAMADRYNPAGRAWKYCNGGWTEPGLRGRTTPIFPAYADWQREDTDSFWGPSIHWNTYLQTYVILMNRSCCTSGWPQESIYISYNAELSNPSGWSQPAAILNWWGWYPQVLGLEPGETDSLVGKKARLWIYGESEWEIEFYRPGEASLENEAMPHPETQAPDPDAGPGPDSSPDPAPVPDPDADGDSGPDNPQTDP